MIKPRHLRKMQAKASLKTTYLQIGDIRRIQNHVPLYLIIFLVIRSCYQLGLIFAILYTAVLPNIECNASNDLQCRTTLLMPSLSNMITKTCSLRFALVVCKAKNYSISYIGLLIYRSMQTNQPQCSKFMIKCPKHSHSTIFADLLVNVSRKNQL